MKKKLKSFLEMRAYKRSRYNTEKKEKTDPQLNERRHVVGRFAVTRISNTICIEFPPVVVLLGDMRSCTPWQKEKETSTWTAGEIKNGILIAVSLTSWGAYANDGNAVPRAGWMSVLLPCHWTMWHSSFQLLSRDRKRRTTCIRRGTHTHIGVGRKGRLVKVLRRFFFFFFYPLKFDEMRCLYSLPMSKEMTLLFFF